MEQKLFDALFREHYFAVLRFAERRIDTETAKDIASETFEIAWRKLDPAEPFGRAWLFQTAYHLLGSAYRRRGRDRDLHERLKRERPDGPETDDQERVADAMELLSPNDREALQLIYWDGLSAIEASVVLGCSERAAWKRVSRAKERLRALITSSADFGKEEAHA